MGEVGIFNIPVHDLDLHPSVDLDYVWRVCFVCVYSVKDCALFAPMKIVRRERRNLCNWAGFIDSHTCSRFFHSNSFMITYHFERSD